MNTSQKRKGWTLVISLTTLMVAGVITAMSIKGQIDLNSNVTNRIVSISATIPLILIVILSKFYPGKLYDERDSKIENKSLIWGIMGTFGFMALTALFFATQYSRGTITEIKATNLITFVYISALVWFFLSSAVGAASYYFENSFSKKHSLQGDSK